MTNLQKHLAVDYSCLAVVMLLAFWLSSFTDYPFTWPDVFQVFLWFSLGHYSHYKIQKRLKDV